MEPYLCGLPSQVHSCFGVVYLQHRYHVFVSVVLYSLVARLDIVLIMAVMGAVAVMRCVPWVCHLSRHRIRGFENSRWLRWMRRDKLFLAIEHIDYDCFVASGKTVSAYSERNGGFEAMEHERDMAEDVHAHAQDPPSDHQIMRDVQVGNDELMPSE